MKIAIVYTLVRDQWENLSYFKYSLQSLTEKIAMVPLQLDDVDRNPVNIVRDYEIVIGFKGLSREYLSEIIKTCGYFRITPTFIDLKDYDYRLVLAYKMGSLFETVKETDADYLLHIDCDTVVIDLKSISDVAYAGHLALHRKEFFQFVEYDGTVTEEKIRSTLSRVLTLDNDTRALFKRLTSKDINEVKSQVRMLNTGVVGLPRGHIDLLHKASELTEFMHPKTVDYSISHEYSTLTEQLSISMMFQFSGIPIDFINHAVVHYWYDRRHGSKFVQLLQDRYRSLK